MDAKEKAKAGRCIIFEIRRHKLTARRGRLTARWEMQT